MTDAKPHTEPSPRDQDQLLRQIYRDFTVCLGGIFAVHKDDIADSVIWEISRSVSGLFRQHLRQISDENSQPTTGQYRPHPAIVHLLRELQAVAS